VSQEIRPAVFASANRAAIDPQSVDRSLFATSCRAQALARTTRDREGGLPCFL
jgi:hypothetical protein